MFTRELPVFCALLLLIVICPTAFAYIGQGQFNILQGQPDIDGLISTGEWGSATWIDMDTVYAGTPADLSQARWAAMWSPSTNLIYVAVTGTDTDHNFNTNMVSWNTQDEIEIYIDPGNTDLRYEATHQYAQHYFMGPDGGGGAWSWIAGQSADSILPPGGYAAGVNGDIITYEFALKPYSNLNLSSPGTSPVLTLESGQVIGLDILMISCDATLHYRALCENAVTGKYKDAGQFLDHTLVAVPDPSTFILLGLGALILRKRRYAGL